MKYDAASLPAKTYEYFKDNFLPLLHQLKQQESDNLMHELATSGHTYLQMKMDLLHKLVSYYISDLKTIDLDKKKEVGHAAAVSEKL